MIYKYESRHVENILCLKYSALGQSVDIYDLEALRISHLLSTINLYIFAMSIKLIFQQDMFLSLLSVAYMLTGAFI